MKTALLDYVSSMKPEEKSLIRHLFSNNHDNSCDECNRASAIAIGDKTINDTLKGVVENIHKDITEVWGN